LLIVQLLGYRRYLKQIISSSLCCLWTLTSTFQTEILQRCVFLADLIIYAASIHLVNDWCIPFTVAGNIVLWSSVNSWCMATRMHVYHQVWFIGHLGRMLTDSSFPRV